MNATARNIENCGINPTLCRAVIRQLGGRDQLSDIATHGASGGYSGFAYYSDTIAFFKRQRKHIVELVKQQASELGESPVDMVCGFNCLAGYDRNDFDHGGRPTAARRARLDEYVESVSRCLYGGRLTDEDTTVANALAWFALEEVARALTDD